MSRPASAPQTQTEQLMASIVDRLATGFGKELMVELFPESPGGYRMNHPRGAVLVAFGKSTFDESEALDSMFQARKITLRLTLVFRQLNGKDGAISYLDRIRAMLTGWKAPHCDIACRPVAETFIGQSQGLWQYGLDISTRSIQMQIMEPENGPRLTQLRFEESP
ncbi:Gp37 family protein [Pseudomonas capsici]|uniref:Gp37 family protein n=1 Tax=Pseudomonas capsici TaxID=2810614 RepID=UPI0021F14465|nr:Gp37 family protein [Pseudomonas capsici]MCV4272297.1 Gp37 family protein [Pseudomonas capsici]